MKTTQALWCSLCLLTALAFAAKDNEENLPRFNPPAEQQHPDEPITTNEVMVQIHPLLQTKSIEKAIQLIADNDTPADVAQNVVKRVLTSTNYTKELTQEDKIQFILGVAHIFRDVPEYAASFFIYTQQVPQKKEDAPLFVITAKGDYADMLTSLINWFKQTRGEKITEKEKNKALLYAAAHDESTTLEALEKNGIKITPELASILLWEAVKHTAKLPTVKFLLSKGANPSYRPKKITNTTMLMEAIRHTTSEQFPELKALVEAKEKEGEKALTTFLNEQTLRAKNDEITPIEVAGNMPEPLSTAIVKYLIEKGTRE